MKKNKNRLTYKKSGVDIAKASSLISVLKDKRKRSGVLSGIGGFASLFAIDNKKYKNPVIVCGTDGVGTKLKLATLLNQHNSIGQDLLAMCVNDVITTGADPILFLDYLATGSINLKIHKTVLKGIQTACNKHNIILIGGETAEMPGMYSKNDYDLAGFCVGLVDKKNILDKKNVKKDNLLVGINSSGIHSNGFSLINNLIDKKFLSLNKKINNIDIKKALIKPTLIYSDIIKKISMAVRLRSMSHITGGGITENLPRVIPDNLTAKVIRDSWVMPKIFKIIQEKSRLTDDDMLKTFNCGLGMIIIIDKKDEPKVHNIIKKNGFRSYTIGKVIKRMKNQSICYD